MEQTVVKIGNSIGVTIPQNLKASFQVKAGDKVVLETKDDKIVISRVLPPQKVRGGVDAHFAQMVDEFIEDHKDVLEKLATR